MTSGYIFLEDKYANDIISFALGSKASIISPGIHNYFSSIFNTGKLVIMTGTAYDPQSKQHFSYRYSLNILSTSLSAEEKSSFAFPLFLLETKVVVVKPNDIITYLGG